ncbi:MAG: efflux transporter outer membrane subunit [Pseudomonadota bacterium]
MRFAALLANTCIASVCVAGCTVGPNFAAPPAPATPGYAMHGDAAPSAAIALSPSADTPQSWWTAFQSPQIESVVSEALRNNPTLAQANATLDQARADAAAERGALAPQVNGQAAAVRERINTAAFGFSGFPSPTISLYSIGASVSFDLDVFGGRRRTVERAEAMQAAEQAHVDAAYLTLSGNVVNQMVLIAGLRAKLAAQDDIVAGDERIRSMVQRAIEAGGQPPAAANTITAQLAEDQAATPPLRQQLAQARHRLALLVGRAPADWEAPDLDLAALSLPANIPLALPSQLVRRRPDILAAEAELHAATANIGVQTAALYPDVSLNPSLLQSAIDPSDIFKGSSSGWTVGPSLTAPIFHGGTLHAHVQAANAEQRAALAAYQETVLEAFVQVADLIQAIGNDQDSVTIQQRAVDAANANVRDSNVAYENGAGPLLSLVDAQRQANRARLNAVDAQVRLYQDVASLYVATAADWGKPAS